MLTIACCFGSRVRVRIRFSVWLVSGYAHVFVLLSIVVVTQSIAWTCRPDGTDMFSVDGGIVKITRMDPE